MIILKRNLFSKMEDEDYLEDRLKEKRSVRHAKRDTSIAGGALGAIPGLYTGLALSEKRPGRGALIGAGIGAGIGATAGYFAGKKYKRDTENRVEREINKYKKVSSKDRAYLRKRKEAEERAAREERRTRAMESMGYNSYRW